MTTRFVPLESWQANLTGPLGHSTGKRNWVEVDLEGVEARSQYVDLETAIQLIGIGSPTGKESQFAIDKTNSQDFSIQVDQIAENRIYTASDGLSAYDVCKKETPQKTKAS
ncbi:hypothetical protein TYRP_011911 [Tyrophagus putrescentiae]|nr:hypothetical protein TYRP_011911 [Tyrophagus putrescentiae]